MIFLSYAMLKAAGIMSGIHLIAFSWFIQKPCLVVAFACMCCTNLQAL